MVAAGNIRYTFPDLQQTAKVGAGGAAPGDAALLECSHLHHFQLLCQRAGPDWHTSLFPAPQARWGQPPPASAALEQRWQLTAASAGQKLGAVALGALNLVGVVALSGLLQDPVNRMALARNGMLWVAAAMPWLQVGGRG